MEPCFLPDGCGLRVVIGRNQQLKLLKLQGMIARSQHVRSNKHVGQSPVHKSTLDKSSLLVVRKVLNSSARNPVAKT